MLSKDIVYMFNKDVLLTLESVTHGKWIFQTYDKNLKKLDSKLYLDSTSIEKLQFHSFRKSFTKEKYLAYMDSFSDMINRLDEQKLLINEKIRSYQRIRFGLRLEGNKHFNIE